jgi:peptidoglycan/xylan/chitin deacetylase (PgdA/CDA1 family)
VECARRHFAALSRRYSFISLEDYLQARKEGPLEKLPAKSMVVTFDDGFKSVYPLKNLFERFKIKPTVYLCSGIVGTHRHFWWSHAGDDIHHCKKMANPERLKFLGEHGYTPETEFPEREALTREEVLELAQVADLQAHTVTHPMLDQSSDSEAEFEIKQCKTELERDFGFHISSFAYPNGNYTPRDVDLVAKAGYESAVTCDRGINDAKTDIFHLRRIGLPDEGGVNEVIVRSSGCWDFLKALAGRDSGPRHLSSGVKRQ